jgi:hypothetical protein
MKLDPVSLRHLIPCELPDRREKPEAWLIIGTGAGDENALFDEVFQAREDGIPCVRVPWTARTSAGSTITAAAAS